MSVFVKADAVERIRRAAEAVPADALGKRDILEQIAAMQAESVAIARQTLEDERTRGETRAEYMRTGQLARYFSVSKPQLLNWLAPLVAAGKVRVIQPKGIDGTPGHERYRVADLERAWEVTPCGKGVMA